MTKTVTPIPANDVRARVASAKFQAVPVMGNLLHQGHNGVLTSQPKAGKTTYLNWMAATQAARPLLYLTEMSDHQWAPLLDYWTPEQRDETSFIFKDQVRGLNWEQIADVLTKQVAADGYVVVIVETARKFWGLGAGEWNDPGPVQECLDRYDEMLDSGTGVLTSHHERKSGGSHGEGMSGTNAFAGAVDTIVTLTRVGSGRKRKLVFDTRFPGVPEEVVIEWQPDGFSYTETEKAEGGGGGLDPTVMLRTAIEKAGAPATFEAIREAWSWKIGKTKLRTIIQAAVTAGVVVQTGSGQRGHPLRYSFVLPPTTQRRPNESNTSGPDLDTYSFAHTPWVQGGKRIDVADNTPPKSGWSYPRLTGGSAA